MILLAWGPTGGRAIQVHGGHAREDDHASGADTFAAMGWQTRDATGCFDPPIAALEDPRFPLTPEAFDALPPLPEPSDTMTEGADGQG